MKRLAQLLVVLAAVVGIPKTAAATTITADYSVQFSNATFPGLAAPWLRVTLDDTAAGGGFDVRMTLEALDLAATEFVSNWWFNVNPTINPLQLGFAFVDLTDVGGGISVTQGADCCNADGGGSYDLNFGFATAAGASRFTNGESVVIDINWSGGALLATDFAVPATPQGGNGPFFAAAFIQGIATGEGGTYVAPGPNGFVQPLVIATPEPTSLVLLGTGLALVARRLRRRR